MNSGMILVQRLRDIDDPRVAANLGIVRKLARNIFRLDTSSKLSLPRKRKNAA